MWHTREEQGLIAYLNEIQRYPSLSKEEERELGKKAAEGDESAVNALVNSNLRLVVCIASRYIKRNLSFEDLIFEGNIGLIQSAKKYDYRRGTRFSTYSAHWVKQAICKALSNTSRFIRIPTCRDPLISRIRDVQSDFLSKNGHFPHVSEISKILGISSEIIDALNLADKTAYLDEFSENSSVMDGHKNLEDEVIKKMCIEDIQKMVNSLPDIKKDIIQRRFGLNGHPNQTLNKISKDYGVCKETIRLRENKIISELRNNANYSRIFEGYPD